MADSQKYGRSANLFDDEIESGFYNDNGELVPDTTTSHSTTYIPVNGTTYAASGLWNSGGTMSNFAVYEWDNDKNWLRRSNRQYPPSSNEITFTIGTDTAYITLQVQTEHDSIMLNTGSTALPYQPYYDWLHSLRKLTTATEAVENPLYSDGIAITSYTISGNTIQNGTPTPSNPVDVNGVGVRTGNLFDAKRFVDTAVPVNATASLSGNTIILSPTEQDAYVNRVYSKKQSVSPDERNCCIPVSGETEYTIIMESVKKSYVSFIGSDYSCVYGYSQIPRTTPQEPFTFTTPSDCAYIVIRLGNWVSSTSTQIEFPNIMLIEGSTVPDSYIPYGYKIPISSGGVTTNIYLGSTQTVRQVKKLIFTGSEDWQVSSAWKKTNTSVFFYNQTDMENTVNNTKIYVMSDKFEATSRDGLYNGDTDMIAKTGSYAMTIRVSDSIATTTQAFKAWLASNPVTAWYVLATPQTAAVNEPLMKIGTYADTLSNATSIPTTEGANSITVDTTVQPSEFTATWTGWHDSSVKEWDGSDWQ